MTNSTQMALATEPFKGLSSTGLFTPSPHYATLRSGLSVTIPSAKRASKILRLCFYFVSLICLTAVLFPKKTFAQTDTEFWFAAPDLSYASTMLLDRPIILVISSYEEGATVTISQPAGGGMPDATISLPPYGSLTHDLTPYLSAIEVAPPDSVQNGGLLIQSSAPISVYYQVVTGVGSLDYKASPETFVLKGQNALGNEFVIPSQTILYNGPDYYPSPYNSFTIVASIDNTDITITPSKDIVGHAAGTSYTITLHRGQAYSATAVSQAADGHLGGSTVTATHPIAITVSDDELSGSLFGGCADNAGDQIIPNNMLGTKYIAMNGALNTPGDYVFLTAISNGTQIEKDGVLVGTIDAGETYDLLIVNPSTFIETTYPVSAWQLSGIGCELGLAQLPSIECTGSFRVSYTRSIDEFLYLNTFTQAGHEANYKINGSTAYLSASDFSPVPGTGGEWVSAKITLPLSDFPINENIVIENTSGLFHVGIMEGGYTTGSAVGYFSDFSSQSIADARATWNCMGDSIKIWVNGIADEVNWSGPNGFSSTDKNNFLIATPEAVGMYYVQVSSQCGNLLDSVYIGDIPDKPTLLVGADTTVCSGESVELTVLTSNPTYEYSWSGPDGFHASIPNIMITSPSSGMYIASANNEGCIAKDTMYVSVIEIPEVTLGSDTIFCIGSRYALNAPNFSDASYSWSTGETSERIWVSESGEYWVEVSVPPSCKSSDTAKIEFVTCESCQPLFPNAFSPNNDGLNDKFLPVFKPFCYLYEYKMQIFNRWGQRIYTAFRKEDGWDGMVGDKPANAGVYMYYISYKEEEDGKEVVLKGDLTLLR